MPSKILYDTRTNEIKRCQPKPYGSASLPSFDGLCKSAMIPNVEKEYMDTCIIMGEYLTYQAKKQFRIVEGELFKKPSITITTNKQQINLINPTFAINVEIINTIETDNFNSIQMSINDVEFTIDVTDNIGNKTIELAEVDTYVISCIDDRFISRPVEVVAIE